MKIHLINTAPSGGLAEGLEAFERQFEYPLGAENRFRISHGSDYTRFFRALGDPACFVVERRGKIEGVLGAAVRELTFPDGSSRPVAYFCDLKVAPSARSGGTLIRLMATAHSWAKSKCAAAFAVVMDGTEATPAKYTGRAGFPAFAELATVMVFRVSVLTLGDATILSDEQPIRATSADVVRCFQRLTAGHYATPCGNTIERSEVEPVGMILPDGSACGIVEDTRKAKRLVDRAGVELRSSHLSCFAYSTPVAGARLIRKALAHSAKTGFPTLFFAVPRQDARWVYEALGCADAVLAPATVFGHGLAAGYRWTINTSEV